MNLALEMRCTLNEFGTLTHQPSPNAVRQLEAVMRAMPQADLPVSHYFGAGVYVRELPIPKDTVLVGKLHKHSHVTLLTKGEVSIITHNGVERLTAPCTFESPAGTKRAIYAHEDSVLVTAHGAYETDLEQLEYALIDQEAIPDLSRFLQ